MLHNVYAALVEVHGFSSTAMDDPSGTEGNVSWLHLFIDALSLQPCNPTREYRWQSSRVAWLMNMLQYQTLETRGYKLIRTGTTGLTRVPYGALSRAAV